MAKLIETACCDLLHVRRECQLGINLDAKTRDDGRRLDAESIKHDFGHGNINQPLARTDPDKLCLIRVQP